MTIHEGLGPDFPSDHTFIKFANMNGTCYINAALQATYNVPIVQRFLENSERIISDAGLTESMEDGKCCLFGHFIKIFIDSMRAPQNEVWYEPTYFLDRVFENKTFVRNEQGDCCEFWSFLMESISNTADQWNEMLAADDKLIRADSLMSFTVVKLGAMRREEEFMYYTFRNSGDHDVNINVQEWVECVNRVVRIGEMFVVCFIVCSMDNGVIRKSELEIEMHEELDIPVCDKVCRYKMQSIICHVGESGDSGHYVCIFKACGRWIVADDANIYGLSEGDLESLLHQQRLPGFGKLTVQMIFYQAEK